MAHKYLNQLGIKSNKIGDKRMRKEHLIKFGILINSKQNSDYNTSDIKCKIEKDNKQFPIVSQVENIEKHTQLEAINYIIKYLEYFLTDHIEPDEYEKEKWDSTFFEKLSLIELKQWECVKCAFRIYAIIIGSMWI